MEKATQVCVCVCVHECVRVCVHACMCVCVCVCVCVNPFRHIRICTVLSSPALLLAYFNGHTGLCDSLVKAGAHPGIANREGVSIFTAPAPTKQLLFRILGQLVYCMSYVMLHMIVT